MSKKPTDHQQQTAVFRYGLISPVLRLSENGPERRALIEQIADTAHVIPGSLRTRVAPGTLRAWIRAYRYGGFEALIPRARRDRALARRLSPDNAERLISIKETHPLLSVRLIIEHFREHYPEQHSVVLPESTVHRLFQRLGLMKGAMPSTPKDHRRFAYEYAGQLWQTDVMYGPPVPDERGRKHKTYLIAFIDDATRVIPYARFAFTENLAAFLPVFKQAVLRRGTPARLFCDNGSVFRSAHLALVCAKLDITLIRAKPFSPEGKGKIERWFRTVRSQLLTRLNEQDTASLEALNRRLLSWIEAEYHRTPHHGIDEQTPLDRWALQAEKVRYPDKSLDLDDLLLAEAQRKVKSDRTVSLHGSLYEIDPTLVGQRVTLRYDPSRPGAPVQVLHEGRFIEVARLVDLYANCFVKRHTHSIDTESQSTTTPATPSAQPTVPESPLALRSLENSDEQQPDSETDSPLTDKPST